MTKMQGKGDSVEEIMLQLRDLVDTLQNISVTQDGNDHVTELDDRL